MRLPGKVVAQQVVAVDRLIDRLLVGEVFPIGQDVRGDEIDGRGELRKVAPDVPDLAGGDGNADRLLDPLDQVDQVLDLLLAAVDRLVADDDADDVAVAPGKLDGGLDLALVAVDVLVDPGADRDLQAELGGDRRHQFDAAGRRVEADRPRHGRELPQVGADFLGARDVVDVGMAGALERRVGNARQNAAEIRRGLLVLEQAPKSGVGSRDEQENSDDGAHRD